MPNKPPPAASTPVVRLRERPGTSSTVTHKETGRVVSEEPTEAVRSPVTIEPSRFPGMVRVGGSVTKNMGNYESVNVNVHVELPIPDGLPSTPEGVRQFYPVMSDLVDELLTTELERATGQQYREEAQS